jgi:Helix-turn-helix domain
MSKPLSSKALPISAGESLPLLVSVASAAKMLSLSEYSVRNLVRRGQLSAKKLSQTHWLITTKSIRQFAEVRAGAA